MGDISTWELFVTSATPVLQLALLASVGAMLAHKGTLNQQGCQVLARLCFYVFNPALTFGKLVQAISIDSVKHFWPLLANMTLSIAVGLAVGYAVATLLRTPPQFKPHALAAIAFGNVGNLPLVFVGPLCHDKRAVFYRTLGDTCEQVSIAYIAFDIAVATIFQFSIAIQLFRPKLAVPSTPIPLDSPSPEDSMAKDPTLSDLLDHPQLLPGLAQQAQQQKAGAGPRLMAASCHGRDGAAGAESGSAQRGGAAASPPPGALVVEMQSQGGAACGNGHFDSGHHRLRPPFSEGFSTWGTGPGGGLTHQQQQQAGRALSDEAEEEPDESDSGWLLGTPHPQQGGTVQLPPAGGSKLAGYVPHAYSVLHKGDAGSPSLARRLLSPVAELLALARRLDWQSVIPLPTQASIAGIIIGCIPPLKHLLYGPDPPLRPLSDVLNTLGNGLIPSTIPLLGAVLYRGPGESTLPWRVTLGVLVTRLVLQPILLTGLVVLCLRLGIFTSPDPVFLFTLLLSNTTPTAINMQTLTVMYKNGDAEMSTILFWQYLASLFTLPAFIWWFLRIIDTWH